MNLLLPLASLLGFEVEDMVDRFKQNAIAWLAIAFFALIGVIFLLVALNTAMVDWIGPIWGPLVIGGGALIVALATYLGITITASIVAKRQAERRHSAEKTALVTTAAITALPMLMRSSLMKQVGLPIGGALAALYLLSKPGGHRDDDD
jgi:hypothetical protein